MNPEEVLKQVRLKAKAGVGGTNFLQIAKALGLQAKGGPRVVLLPDILRSLQTYMTNNAALGPAVIAQNMRDALAKGGINF